MTASDVLLAGLLSLLGFAAAAAGEPPAAVPPPELLEFMLEWETDDGQWIDPAELAAPDWPEDRRYEPGAEREQDHVHE